MSRRERPSSKPIAVVHMPAEAVFDGLTVAELAWRERLLQRCRLDQPVAIERLVPQGQFLDRGLHVAVAVNKVERGVVDIGEDPLRARCSSLLAAGVAGSSRRRPASDSCQGLKHVAAQELRVAETAHSLDHLGKQQVAGVAVPRTACPGETEASALLRGGRDPRVKSVRRCFAACSPSGDSRDPVCRWPQRAPRTRGCQPVCVSKCRKVTCRAQGGKSGNKSVSGWS